MKWLLHACVWMLLPAVSPAEAAAPPLSVCVQTISEVVAVAFPTSRPGRRPAATTLELDFAKSARCVQGADGQQTAAILIKLDEDATPRTFKLTTIVGKDAILPARVRLLDDAFTVIKEYSFERFVKRGTDFCMTVFLDGAEHARYLLVSPDLDWVGRSNHSVSGHRWTTVWTAGVVTGVFSNGYESNTDVPFAVGGTIRIELEDDARVMGATRN